jgi:hypothetical protein
MAKLKAGYGEKVITPPLGAELSGYGFYLERKAESVLDDLKARALFLDDGGQRLLLISCDLVGFAVSAADAIRKAVSNAAKVPVSNIMLACTHTHTGPATLPLPGIGEMDPGYMKALPAAIAEAAENAAADASSARFSYSFEALEPLGYNRRNDSFEDVDPYLKIAYFESGRGDILLLSYACHAVILGRTTQVSADWPGAAVRAVEATGRRAMVLQGFCGDIDPVTQMNRWGEGSAEDLALYGRIIADRALKSRRYATTAPDAHLRTAERRIQLPLAVPPRERIDDIGKFFLDKNRRFPLADRFEREWRETAYGAHAALALKPSVDDIPVQTIDIGGLEIIGLPGEVFSRFGLNLKKTHPALVPVGYANGDIGYFPSRRAFDDPGDYAAYCAPMFYTVFPFTSDLEDIITKASLDILAELKP